MSEAAPCDSAILFWSCFEGSVLPIIALKMLRNAGGTVYTHMRLLLLY